MKYMDVIPPAGYRPKPYRNYDQMQVDKFINNLPSRACRIGDKVVLLVYNKTRPELSYFAVENI